MSQTLELVPDLIKQKYVLVSDHGYDELAEDDMFVTDPAVFVTAYRPDPDRWVDDFIRRKP